MGIRGNRARNRDAVVLAKSLPPLMSSLFLLCVCVFCGSLVSGVGRRGCCHSLAWCLFLWVLGVWGRWARVLPFLCLVCCFCVSLRSGVCRRGYCNSFAWCLVLWVCCSSCVVWGHDHPLAVPVGCCYLPNRKFSPTGKV